MLRNFNALILLWSMLLSLNDIFYNFSSSWQIIFLVFQFLIPLHLPFFHVDPHIYLHHMTLFINSYVLKLHTHHALFAWDMTTSLHSRLRPIAAIWRWHTILLPTNTPSGVSSHLSLPPPTPVVRAQTKYILLFFFESCNTAPPHSNRISTLYKSPLRSPHNLFSLQFHHTSVFRRNMLRGLWHTFRKMSSRATHINRCRRPVTAPKRHTTMCKFLSVACVCVCVLVDHAITHSQLLPMHIKWNIFGG